MVDEQIPVYTVNIQGQQTKALDAIALKNWFVKRRIVNSIQKVNLDNLPDTSVAYLVGKVCQDNLNELEGFLDQVLGLVKEVEPVEEEQEEQQSEDQFGQDDEIEIEEQPQQKQKIAKAFSSQQFSQQKQPSKSNEEIIL